MSPQIGETGRSYAGPVADSGLGVASAARTTNSNSSTRDAENIAFVYATLDVSAVGGTPTLDVTLQGSVDGTNWYSLGTFAQKTGVAAEKKAFAAAAKYLRWSWAIGGGTPSTTFSIVAEVQRLGG